MGGGASGHGVGSGSNSFKVNWDKQNKHDKNSKKYVDGKSYVSLPKDKIQKFIDEHLSTAQKIGENKYRVQSNEIVGMYVDKQGNTYPTTNAIIVTSKTGSHMYPSRPDDYEGD